MLYSSAKLMGGLGNQMFQIAHAYAQALNAKKNGVDVIPRFDMHVAWLEKFPERQAANYKSNILRNVDFNPFTVPESGAHDWQQIHEEGFHYKEINPTWVTSVKFNGYFQSEKYFKAYRQDVVDLFAAPEEIKTSLLEEFPQLVENTTAVFVRRGDYLKYPEIHPPTTEEYLKRALEINAATNPKHYLIVSDDYAWCIETLGKYLPKDKITNAVCADWKQLWLASLCSNFICTNSTFGWWSAFLSSHPGKQIIFPATWFGPSGPQNWQDIYLEDGIII
jgi:hypothetical protein